jgi:hypothetical protein
VADPGELDRVLQDSRWNDNVTLVLKDGRKLGGGYRYVDGVVWPHQSPLEAIPIGQIKDVLLADRSDGPE